MSALLAAIPVDPEADSRVSDRARASFVAVLMAAQFFVRLYFDPPGAARPPEPISGRQFALWLLVTLVAGAIAAALFRRRLLANRISRQLFASIAVVYYASAFGEYIGVRLGANAATVDAFAFLWIGASSIVLGVTLRPFFVPLGAVMLAAAGVVVAHPEHADLLDRLVPTVLAVGLALGWGFGNRYSAGRGARSP